MAHGILIVTAGTTWVTNMMKRMQEGRAQEREIDMLQELVSASIHPSLNTRLRSRVRRPSKSKVTPSAPSETPPPGPSKASSRTSDLKWKPESPSSEKRTETSCSAASW